MRIVIGCFLFWSFVRFGVFVDYILVDFVVVFFGYMLKK